MGVTWVDRPERLLAEALTRARDSMPSLRQLVTRAEILSLAGALAADAVEEVAERIDKRHLLYLEMHGGNVERVYRFRPINAGAAACGALGGSIASEPLVMVLAMVGAILALGGSAVEGLTVAQGELLVALYHADGHRMRRSELHQKLVIEKGLSDDRVREAIASSVATSCVGEGGGQLWLRGETLVARVRV